MIDNLSSTKLSYLERMSLFRKISTDYLIMDAIFSDETESFVKPCEPILNDTVTINIRTAKNNVDRVFISLDEGHQELLKTSTDELFDYYSYRMRNITKNLSYYFIIEKHERTYYYSKNGLSRDLDFNYNFKIIPGFKTPDWAKGAVMYQIYVDRFYNGDQSNDVRTNEYTYLGKAAKRIEDWNQDLANEDICNFYGGDLQGVIDKMDYLADLGVEVIYFNPIFVSPSNHKYDIQDYDYVDPHYGVIVNDGGETLTFEKFRNRYATMYMKRTTDKENLEASNAFFCKLVAIAHEKGIKVILDGVFNHCGAFNKWLDKEGFYFKNGYPDGAYKSETSLYHSYFKWFDTNWPNNDCYDSWWGFDNHPKLNYEASLELYNYIIEIGKKWVSEPYNADGWRLDVAADLGTTKEFNHQFWRDFRRAVREANPNALILAEHYGDPSDWLQGDQWDTVMNYDAFMEPLTWFLTGMEKHSEGFNAEILCNTRAFQDAMNYHMSRFNVSSLQVSMNELSNHDHSRFLTRTNMKIGRLHTVGKHAADMGISKAIMMEAVVFQMMWPGAPTIYYGDEAGLTGWTDPDNRRPYPWGNEDQVMLELHKELIKIHKTEVIKTGSMIYLHMDYAVISFGRFNEKDKFAVILNNDSRAKEFQIPVWKMNIVNGDPMEQLILTENDKFHMEKTEYTVEDGHIKIKMPARSAVILKNKI